MCLLRYLFPCYQDGQIVKRQLWLVHTIMMFPTHWQVLNRFSTQDLNLAGYQHCLPLACPLILSVFDIILSILATSVDYERGFSTMRQVKTDWRSKLHIITLNDCMRIFWRVLPLQTLLLPMLYTTGTMQE